MNPPPENKKFPIKPFVYRPPFCLFCFVFCFVFLFCFFVLFCFVLFCFVLFCFVCYILPKPLPPNTFTTNSLLNPCHKTKYVPGPKQKYQCHTGESVASIKQTFTSINPLV
eukprot:Phypoly_transcript_17453.p1 GENE.Phypoly_transcript_17453~~Phypoly_transcript_17453.p1  ORF type:complete len:122 (+),score=12.48 Phypoly_transcript_17453:36-368(+)